MKINRCYVHASGLAQRYRPPRPKVSPAPTSPRRTGAFSVILSNAAGQANGRDGPFRPEELFLLNAAIKAAGNCYRGALTETAARLRGEARLNFLAAAGEAGIHLEDLIRLTTRLKGADQSAFLGMAARAGEGLGALVTVTGELHGDSLGSFLNLGASLDPENLGIFLAGAVNAGEHLGTYLGFAVSRHRENLDNFLAGARNAGEYLGTLIETAVRLADYERDTFLGIVAEAGDCLDLCQFLDGAVSGKDLSLFPAMAATDPLGLLLAVTGRLEGEELRDFLMVLAAAGADRRNYLFLAACPFPV